MAFVPKYQNDIFVSYAHVDDKPLPPAEIGWITTLVGCIRTVMAQKLGRSDAYKLWYDDEVSAAYPVTSQILKAASETAILVVILSPGYVASKWCQKERKTFLNFVQERGVSRVFVVERDAVDDDVYPSAFRDLKTFRFWEQDLGGMPPRIFGSPEPDKTDKQYYRQVDKLCLNLVRALKALKLAAQSSEAGSPPESWKSELLVPGQPTVFLAQVTDDLERKRDSVRSYLDQKGVNVLPHGWYSLDPESFRIAAQRDISKCDLYVQLLSELPGKKPPDLPRGYGWLQLELAKAAEKPILQWCRSSLDPQEVQDENHRALLQSGIVRAEGLEDFKQEIGKRVDEKPAPEPARPLNAFVFVDMETADRKLAEKVCAVLDSYGASYMLPLLSDDPAKNRQDLETALRNCDAVIIVYGSATAQWVRGQLVECRKTGTTRESPLEALAVFEGPPEEKDPLDLKISGMKVLNCRKETMEALREFLDGIRT